MEEESKAKARLNKLGYNNIFYPFEDCFRQDRIVIFNTETSDRIEIFNSPYILKYNELTGKLMTLTTEECRGIKEFKEELGWCKDIQLSYITKNDSQVFGVGNRNYSFYKPGLDMDRVQKVLKETISMLSFDEVCKMFREICYDQICYYGEDNKGHIYNNNEYTQKHIEQATYLQRKISTAVDLYAQVIVDKHTFDEKYLEERLGL